MERSIDRIAQATRDECDGGFDEFVVDHLWLKNAQLADTAKEDVDESRCLQRRFQRLDAHSLILGPQDLSKSSCGLVIDSYQLFSNHRVARRIEPELLIEQG